MHTHAHTHTCTHTQVQGWRVYMTFVSQENQSHFVYRHPLDHVRQVIMDRDFQANLFRVDGASQNPLWHAVVSTGRYIATH